MSQLKKRKKSANAFAGSFKLQQYFYNLIFSTKKSFSNNKYTRILCLFL